MHAFKYLMITIPGKWLNSFIWPIYRSLIGTTNPDQSGSGSNHNEVVLNFLELESHNQFSAISRTLVGWVGGSYTSAEGHPTAPPPTPDDRFDEYINTAPNLLSRLISLPFCQNIYLSSLLDISFPSTFFFSISSLIYTLTFFS